MRSILGHDGARHLPSVAQVQGVRQQNRWKAEYQK